MIKVNIHRNGVISNAATFTSQSLAENWVEQNSKYFGKPERWIKESELTEEEILNSVEQEQREKNSIISEDQEEKEFEVYYKFNQDFTIEYLDITAQVIAEKKLADRALKRSFGQNMVDKIATINDAKGLTHEQVDAFMTNELIINLQAHLVSGNIETFIFKLNSVDVSDFFSEQEKSAVILECENFLTKLAENP
jgi:hypothetical protein